MENNLFIRIKNGLSELTWLSEIANDFSQSHRLSPDIAATRDLDLHEIIPRLSLMVMLMRMNT
jgi:hypothetical protein